MRIFLFGAETGNVITHFDSEHARLSRGVRTVGATVVGCLHLGPAGRLGRHPATLSQLLMVVAGDGWVEGGDGRRVPIRQRPSCDFAWVGEEPGVPAFGPFILPLSETPVQHAGTSASGALRLRDPRNELVKPGQLTGKAL